MAVFQQVAWQKLRRQGNSRFLSNLSCRFKLQKIQILMDLRAFDEVIEVAKKTGAARCSMDALVNVSRALFEIGRFEEAHEALAGWFQTDGARYGSEVLQFKGELALITGHENKADEYFKTAARSKRHLAGPHQNLAARDSGAYVFNKVDMQAGQLGRLYDVYNYVGQRVTHVGSGHLGPAMYAQALRAQKTLRADFPTPSPALQRLLGKLGIPLQELRVVPTEWFTQIGHQAAMLDVLFRMRKLGWWSGKAIMLPKPDLIANRVMASLFDGEGSILLQDVDLDKNVTGELLSLQRYCGLSFNAFEWADGSVVPWQDAGALLMQQWEQEGRGHPVREAFDNRIGCVASSKTAFDGMKRQWGMKPGDWYVTLHMRDASHYGETAGFGQSHRNAEVENYLTAIEHVTRLGGWVIKLGGPASPRLPHMERVIDYARSVFKSELMDLWLIRNCRFFIGTTSGLANVAVSFGIPCALVNCITTDAQLWHSGVRFALKPVTVEAQRELSQLEITSSPWRWRLFSAETLLHHGAIAAENSADEILETVKEVVDLAAGGGSYQPGACKAVELINKWRASLSIPHYYGAALPSIYYLQKHAEEFLAGRDRTTSGARMIQGIFDAEGQGRKVGHECLPEEE